MQVVSDYMHAAGPQSHSAELGSAGKIRGILRSIQDHGLGLQLIGVPGFGRGSLAGIYRPLTQPLNSI